MRRTLFICATATTLLAGCAYNDHDGRYADPGPGPGPAPAAGPGQAYYNGCSDTEAFGTVGGAIVGGVIGNQFGSGSGRAAATIGGAILGGIAGNAIARDACRDDRYDAYYYNPVYYDAFDEPAYGRRYSWRNPRNGNYGYVTPVRALPGRGYGYAGDCREFRQTVYVNRHRTEETVSVACRTKDGWRIVSR